MQNTKTFDIVEQDGKFVEKVISEVTLEPSELLKYCHNLPVRVKQINAKIAEVKKDIEEKKQEKELAELESDLKKIEEQLEKANKLAEPILAERTKEVTNLVQQAKTDKGWKKSMDGDTKAKLRAHIMADICAGNPDWNRGEPWIEEIVKKELS